MELNTFVHFFIQLQRQNTVLKQRERTNRKLLVLSAICVKYMKEYTDTVLHDSMFHKWFCLRAFTYWNYISVQKTNI